MKSARESVDHVRVCCRVRPLSSNEKQMHKELCVDYPSHATDVIECKTPATSASAADNTAALWDATYSTSATERHSFTFSRVFRPEAGQADVYAHVARPIVADVISGYNGTIFMYGQTGSGKTHTMFGDMKGGAWPVGAEGTSSAPPSARLPAENAVHLNEEGGDEYEKERECPSGDEEDDCEGYSDDEDNDEALRPFMGAATAEPAAPSASSFCRARATVTPLGELRQINSLQTAVGMSYYKQKSMSSTKKADGSCSLRMLGRPKSGKTQESRYRSAFAKDSMSGIIPRAVHDIFRAIADADPSTEFEVQMFFVEVYMEQIRDLLIPAASTANGNTHGGMLSGRRPAQKLQLREDVSTNSFYIDGCRMPRVSSAREVLQLVKAGLKYRATSATAMNETSSRSHCILNLTVKSVNHSQCISTVGKLYLVDLAGSEKVGKTNASGLRLEEAKLINKSLSTLGMVIMSLTDQNATHTPYRNSVLTKILKDSLGGNSHTALVICCSPSPYNALETLSTLRFGARAKAIENKAVVNRELTAAQLKRMLDSAKDEIEHLHGRIRQLMNADKSSNGGYKGSSSTLYDSFAAFAALMDENGHSVGSAFEAPASASRKLASASAASSSAHTDHTQDSRRISTLLEERASEQERVQQFRAEVAQLQDCLNAAQETIATLQEERDGYLDRIQSFQEEMQVWEAAHQDALHRAATQEALLQQCKVLLLTQSSEIDDLMKAMQDYTTPILQAKAAMESWNMSAFGPDAPSKRCHTLIAADTTSSPVRTAMPAATEAYSESRTGRLSGLSNIPECESPNPRRQLITELGDVSIVLPQTSRSQQWQGPHTTEGHLSGASSGLSPAVAAAQEWVSRHPSAEQESIDHAGLNAAAQAQCILQLEDQLDTLSKEHAALQQQHKDALAELRSKQRILELRRSRLENVKEELRNEYNVNKDLRERLEKEREAVRAPLEMARNDANYWRRRFEELASRRDGQQPGPSEIPRGSLRFAFPPSYDSKDVPSRIFPLQPRNSGSNDARSSGVGSAGDGGRAILAQALASKTRLSLSSTPSHIASCRGSGENVLLSLSSHCTPIRSSASPHHVAPQPAEASSAAKGAMASAVHVEAERVPSPQRARCASRSVSPSANSKL
ncbi:putative kinesin heavy chain [Leptomonas seymouri]|uniref:Putative kinesin heavy chain n=1 Tax=Leptomonas seymouri TaxID=5684 RepID=A0A0N0P7H0_LEPSE|nr:putative kinesin heavy chain [Leptomonas seymouri]|eukprot:KPI88786.1 putative kinesin heavy chain [Leptomonas seymouri]